MECVTVSRYKKNGDAVLKNKKQHETFAAANVEANRINSKKTIFIKREAYKCNLCGKFHVGTTFEMLKNKEIKRKHLGVKMVRLKVLGEIDKSLLVKRRPSENQPKVKKKKVVKPIQTKNTTYLVGGIWKYEIRKKTVKITSPNGTVKIPKIERDFDSNATIETVKTYIRKNYQKLTY